MSEGRYRYKANVMTSPGASFIYCALSSFLVYPPVPLVFNCIQPDTGAVDKPPIIFLHGITSTKEYWGNIPHAIANASKRKVYVIDSRNHGDSEWSDVFNFDCNVDDLLHFMDYIRAPSAILVGHSMGGTTAIKTALRAPERVEKLVVEEQYVSRISQGILDMVLKYLSQVKAALEVLPAGVDEGTAMESIKKYISLLPKEMKSFSSGNPSDIQLKQTPDGRYSIKSNVPVLERELVDAKTLMSESNGVYQGPATFIYGSLSPLRVGEDKENIGKHFPNAEFFRVENATHNIHYGYPTEYIDYLLNFFV